MPCVPGKAKADPTRVTPPTAAGDREQTAEPGADVAAPPAGAPTDAERTKILQQLLTDDRVSRGSVWSSGTVPDTKAAESYPGWMCAGRAVAAVAQAHLLTLAQLKEHSKLLGLRVSGRKDELIDALRAHFELPDPPASGSASDGSAGND